MRMLSPRNFGKRDVPSVRSIQRPTSVPRTELEIARIFVGLPVRRIVIDTITLAPRSDLSFAVQRLSDAPSYPRHERFADA